MEMEVGCIYYFHFISVRVFFHFCIISHNEKQEMIHLLKLYQSTWTCKKHSALKQMIFLLQDQSPNGLPLLESGTWRLMERREDASPQCSLPTLLTVWNVSKGLRVSCTESKPIEFSAYPFLGHQDASVKKKIQGRFWNTLEEID